jgi:hypothetical protein
MKSLEIVNEHIKFIDDHSTQIKGTPVMIDDLQQIKQDLEVLEIINKKDVDIGYIKDLVKRFDDNEYILERYNEIVSALYKLTLEELLKLKQWLEVNENA